MKKNYIKKFLFKKNKINWIMLKLKHLYQDVKIFIRILRITMKKLKKINAEANELDIILPLFHWGGANVIWLQIILALKLHTRGHKVYFAFDDKISQLQGWSLKFALARLIIKVMHCENFSEVTPKKAAALEKSAASIVYRKAYFNAQWQQKKSLSHSEFQSNYTASHADEISYAKIGAILLGRKYDICLCPGGIYGNSYFWRTLCEHYGVKFCSFDGDSTKTIFSPNGAAAHRYDVCSRADRNTFDNYSSMEEKVRSDIYKRSQLSLSDFTSLHIRKTEMTNSNVDVAKFFKTFAKSKRRVDETLEKPLIMLNTSWDSAALDLEPWRVSQMDWLLLLIEDLINNGSRQIKIRQHPDEAFYPSRDAYKNAIRRINQSNPNVKIEIISPSQNVNSYDLLRDCTSVFTFSSTIGLEACILGRPTFVYKNNYQAKMNALVQYQPNELHENIKLYFESRQSLYENSIKAFYLGQLRGWHDLSISKLDMHLSKKEFFNDLDKIVDYMIAQD